MEFFNFRKTALTLALTTGGLLAMSPVMAQVAIGITSSANPINGTAIGDFSHALGAGATAIGGVSNASGSDSTVIGSNSAANGDSSIAIGAIATASAQYSIAEGVLSAASGIGSISIGAQSAATADDSTALGFGSHATGLNSTANGYSSNAGGLDSVAIGSVSSVMVDGGIAIGGFARVDPGSIDSVAIGHYANVTNNAYNSVAIGAFSTATEINTFSIGSVGNERRIVYVAAGVNATDAVNKAQLDVVAAAAAAAQTTADAANTRALQGVAGPVGATGAQGVAGPMGATGAQGVAGPMGATGAQGVAGPVGATGAAGSTGSVGATGAQGVAGPVGATGATGAVGATGAQGAAGPVGATAPIDVTRATGLDGTKGTSLIGGASVETSAHASAVANGTVTEHAVLGTGNSITMVSGATAGSQVSMTLTNGIGNTHGIVIQEDQTVISGGTHSTTMTLADNGAAFANAQTGEAVVISGVANGVAATDAVNMSQVTAAVAPLNTRLTAVEASAKDVTRATGLDGTTGTSLLGGAMVDTSAHASAIANGAVATHAVLGAGNSITMVNGATNGAQVSMTLTNGLGNTHGIVIQENQTVISGGIHSTTMTLTDTGATFANAQAGGAVIVSGVASGVAATDAANVGQVEAAVAPLNMRLANVETNVQILDQKISDVESKLSGGVAMATALTQPVSFAPGSKNAVTGGFASYNGQSAMAFSFNRLVINSSATRMIVSAGVGVTRDGQSTARIGGSFSW